MKEGSPLFKGDEAGRLMSEQSSNVPRWEIWQSRYPEFSTLDKFNLLIDEGRHKSAYPLLSGKLPNEILFEIIDYVDQLESEPSGKDILWNRYLSYEILMREEEEGKEWSDGKKELFKSWHNDARRNQEADINYNNKVGVVFCPSWSRAREEAWMELHWQRQQRWELDNAQWREEREAAREVALNERYVWDRYDNTSWWRPIKKIERWRNARRV